MNTLSTQLIENNIPVLGQGPWRSSRIYKDQSLEIYCYIINDKFQISFKGHKSRMSSIANVVPWIIADMDQGWVTKTGDYITFYFDLENWTSTIKEFLGHCKSRALIF